MGSEAGTDFGSKEKEEARDLCELCNEMKVEAAIIQSKHDARFEDFMSENPCGGESSIRLHRAKYSRDCYYTNVRSALQDRIWETRTLPRAIILGKFLPLFVPMTSEGAPSQHAMELIEKVTAFDLPVFDRMFFDRWDVIAKNMKYSSTPLREMFDEFTDAEYFDVLEEAVNARSEAFRPKNQPDVDGATADVQK